MLNEPPVRPGIVMAHRGDIDGLRGLAIIPVLLFHAKLGIPGGYAGVDVFFVISGYLITRMIDDGLADGGFSLLDFYFRRVKRLLPAMVVMLAVVSAVAAIVLTPLELEDFGKCLLCVVAFVANLADRTRGGYFAPAMDANPLLHMWSLSIEEQFYAVWPPVLILLGRPSLKRSKPLVIGLIVVASLAASCAWLRSDAIGGYYVLSSRAFELAIGAFVAQPGITAMVCRWPRLVREAAACLGLGLIGLAYALYDSSTLFPGLAALAPCIGAAMVIAAGQAQPAYVSRLLSARPLAWIGLISYSLYLWHWPVLVFARLLSPGAFGTAAKLGALVITFAIAWISYRYVELPGRRFRPRPRPAAREATGKSDIIVAGAMALAGIAMVGEIFTNTGGLAWRNPATAWAAPIEAEYQAFQQSACLSRTSDLPSADSCAFMPPQIQSTDQVAVWGDSHAMQLQPLLRSLGAKGGYAVRMMTKAGCPPLLGVSVLPADTIRKGCSAFDSKAAQAIMSDHRIKTVVVSARWDSYASGEWRLSSDGTRPSIAASRAELIASLRHSLKALTASGKTVILVGQVPVPGVNPVNCYVRSQILGRPTSACETINAAAGWRVHEDTTQLLALASEGLVGVRLVDPYSTFCTATSCDLIRGTAPLYLDDMHLSAAGADLMWPLFTQSIASN